MHCRYTQINGNGSTEPEIERTLRLLTPVGLKPTGNCEFYVFCNVCYPLFCAKALPTD